MCFKFTDKKTNENANGYDSETNEPIASFIHREQKHNHFPFFLLVYQNHSYFTTKKLRLEP